MFDTIKDVRVAIIVLDAKLGDIDVRLGTLESTVAAHRLETDAHRRETAAHRLETDTHRTETAKGFADLDKELARHADPVHRKFEAEVAALRKQVTAKKAARPATVRRPRRG